MVEMVALKWGWDNQAHANRVERAQRLVTRTSIIRAIGDEIQGMCNAGPVNFVAIDGDRGYCSCQDFNFKQKRFGAPCKHLIALRMLIAKVQNCYPLTGDAEHG